MQANMTENDGAPRWWKKYISSDPVYSELQDLRTKALDNPDADKFPQARRKETASTRQQTKEGLFRIMETVGEYLAADPKVFDLHTSTPQVLDLCLSPGGIAASVEKALPGSTIDAIILGTPLGGYNVMNPQIFRSIMHTDATIYDLIDEGVVVKDIETGLFDITRPYLGDPYDLIFCGGAVTEEQPKEVYRGYCEAIRLSVSQLVFALDRLKQGGSLVLLLHQIDTWHTVCILHALSMFADIQVYKHPEIHAIKSSFYLVAKNVNLNHEGIKQTISNWRDLWRYLGSKDHADAARMTWKYDEIDSDEGSKREVQQFGPRFLELARPVWKIQASAMRRASFN